jgi:hypothetical protein
MKAEPILTYESSTSVANRALSAFGVVGTALSLMCMWLASREWWNVVSSLRGTATSVSVHIGGMFYVVPATAMLLCVIGALRGRR